MKEPEDWLLAREYERFLIRRHIQDVMGWNHLYQRDRNALKAILFLIEDARHQKLSIEQRKNNDIRAARRYERQRIYELLCYLETWDTLGVVEREWPKTIAKHIANEEHLAKEIRVRS